MLKILDILFTLLHLSIICINLFGWIHPKTRYLHFIFVCATLFSWLVLGVWYGFGYCPITDWQWQIKENLGETDLPSSFIKYFADWLTGKDFDPVLIDTLTALGFAISIIAAVIFQVKRFRTKRLSL